MDGLPKILIIEDNPQLREIYTIMLQTAGYTVETAPDGPHGLEQCMQFQPQIIFLDIMMPGMSGLEVLNILREKPEYNGREAKIVLLTNLGHDDRIEEAWQKKADGYVVKADINATDLIDVISSLMEKGTTGGAGEVPAGTGVAAPMPPDNELSELGITAPATESPTATPQSPEVPGAYPAFSKIIEARTASSNEAAHPSSDSGSEQSPPPQGNQTEA